MSEQTLWSALIPLVVPLILAALKLVIPKLPGWLLPILAPILGAAADIAMHYGGLATAGPGWGALLGSAGVGLRELQDQIRQSLAVWKADEPPANP